MILHRHSFWSISGWFRGLVLSQYGNDIVGKNGLLLKNSYLKP